MSSYVLGISVTVDTLHAVLLERTEEGLVPRMTRRISQTPEPELPGESQVPPDVGEEADDVTIQFGEEESGDDLFMDSEFGDLQGEDELGGSGGTTTHWNFRAALEEVLDVCAENDYEDPEIGFCASADEIDEIELRLPSEQEDEEAEGPRGLPLPASRSQLLEMLEEQYDGAVEEERVGFVPMHQTGDGRPRVLALIARPGGSTFTTLSTMQNQTLARSPRATLMDTEVSLYLSLARSALQFSPGTQEKTILVRVGSDDTLVLFMEGNTLRQAEHLPELTVDDPAETICSRVLLLQDEYGMGEVQHLLLVADDQEETLSDAFTSYFANAHLRRLRTHLPVEGDTEGLNVPAVGVALRLLDESGIGPSVQPINLLPKRYQASALRLPVGWSVPALLGLLFATTLGFVWFYIANANEISEREAELRSLQQEIADVDPQGLQRRIDSLEQGTVQYSEALSVVDGLLEGSNKWSRGLATLTGRLNDITGLSVSGWNPVEENEVEVSGTANSRRRVARLARELGGEINVLTFTEVREAALFNFVLTVPLDSTKPDAVEYWREQQAERRAADGSPNAGSTSTRPLADATRDTVGTDDTGNAGASPSAGAGDETTAGEPVWTIVVGSLRDEGPAQEAAQRFRERLGDADYGVQVRRSASNGRYRVCVGTFSSFSGAQEMLEDRDDLFPEDAWFYEYAPEGESTAAFRNAAGTSASSSARSSSS